jgi:hypothetical protein
LTLGNVFCLKSRQYLINFACLALLPALRPCFARFARFARFALLATLASMAGPAIEGSEATRL